MTVVLAVEIPLEQDRNLNDVLRDLVLEPHQPWYARSMGPFSRVGQ
jgi:hypothetical protein